MESIERDILICREAHLVCVASVSEPRWLLLGHSDSFLPLRRNILYFFSVSS